MSAKQISDLVGPDIWSQYYKFTIIRNPFDKLISGFYFKLHRQVLKDVDGNSEIEQFRNWIKMGGAIIDRDKYLINGEECIDYFIRFENLHEGIEHVCNHLSISFNPSSIPQFKKGIRNQKIRIEDYFDKDTTQIIQNKYAWELERFGYDLPK
jgi:hypothetical protein